MRIYIVLFFLGSLFLTSCHSDKLPANVIPQAKMINLLTDLHIVDGSLYGVNQMPDSLYKYGMDKYVQLFKRYHTDTLQFRISMQYYTSRPELLDKMYDTITLRIKGINDSLNKINKVKVAEELARNAKKIKNTADSIKNVKQLTKRSLLKIDSVRKKLKK